MNERNKGIWSRLVPTGLDTAGKETYRLEKINTPVQADFHASTQAPQIVIDSYQDLQKIADDSALTFAHAPNN